MLATILFDVEDTTTPPEYGIDELAMLAARVLEEEGLPATFLVVGEKARALRDRGRRDVIGALARHEIGLHTNRGSSHPTVVEAIADLGFEDAVRAIEAMEGPGVRDVEAIFGREIGAFSSHGGTHAAPYVRYAALRGKPWVYSPAVIGGRGAGWFAGGLQLADGLAVNEGFYAESDLLEGALRAWDEAIDRARRAGRLWLALFLGHPVRFRAELVGDAVNFADGATSHPRRVPPMRSADAVERAREGLRRTARHLAAKRELQIVPIAEVARRLGSAGGWASREELAGTAETARLAGPFGIPLQGKLSPAQATAGWARGLLDPSDPVEVGDPLGPLAEPGRHVRIDAIDPEAARAVARVVLGAIGRTGALPAGIRAGGMELPIGAIHHVLAEAFRRDPRHAAGPIRLSPIYGRYPSEAYEIDARVRRALLSWPIHPPDLATDPIARDFRLQAWTVRDAVPCG